MMDQVVGGELVSGFSVGMEAPRLLMVPHLFADDTLIFCDVDPDQVFQLRYLLTQFEAISGLKVNLAKSELVPMGDVPFIEDLAGILGCKTSCLSMNYLGLPLGAKFKAKSIQNGVLENMEKRLAD